MLPHSMLLKIKEKLDSKNVKWKGKEPKQVTIYERDKKIYFSRDVHQKKILN